MRRILIAVCLYLTASAGAVFAAETDASIKEQHPVDTALSEDADGTFHYKSFPGLSTLYVFDRDEPGKSKCGKACDSAWSPLLVTEAKSAEKIGQWTVIRGQNGRRQWAYKQQPVYTRYHDIPPDADSEKEGFHVLQP